MNTIGFLMLRIDHLKAFLHMMSTLACHVAILLYFYRYCQPMVLKKLERSPRNGQDWLRNTSLMPITLESNVRKDKLTNMWTVQCYSTSTCSVKEGYMYVCAFLMS